MTHEPPPLPIRTERLTLRAATPDDVAAGLSYWGDPEVCRYLPFDALDREGAFRRVARYLDSTAPQESGEALFLMVEADDRAVGDVMLRLRTGRPPAVAELGWVLHPDHTGRGIATEAVAAMAELAFTHYDCHRVEAHYDLRNERSAALCRRLGMTEEARLRRDHQYADGEWADTGIHALLREEWGSRPQARGTRATTEPEATYTS